MRLRAALILGALLVLASSNALFAQGFQGGLRGSVKDNGGVVPGVEVTLTNEQTNVKRSTVTNERGEYAFVNVDTGNYAVKAVLQGYKTVDRGGIRIGTQQFLTLDLTLEVGTISESVTVTGSAPLIDTSNASSGTVLDTAALQTLPAPGRSAFMIGTTVPTVVMSGDTQFNRQQDQTNVSLISLGGGTRRGNNYTLDGVPITDLRNRMSGNPTIEGLDDLKVQVHTYDAEMGRTGGGVFNTTMRSGTNTFHGTGFYQTRPIWATKNNYFSQIASDVAAAKGDSVQAARLSKPDAPYYLGGGGFGGPIRKDKTFFWVATEMYTDTQTRNAAEVMPTAAERAGDFSAATNLSGAPVTIYDPLTRLPFPNNQIPANRINPVAAAMLKYLPAADTQIDNGSANYNRTSLIKSKMSGEVTGKIEHKFNDKVTLTGFYLFNRSNEPCSNYFGSADINEPTRFADPGDYLLVRRPKILALNNTWVLNESSVMALRFGVTRFPDNDTLSIPFDPSSLGFSQTFLNQITVQKFPQVDIKNYRNEGRTLGAIEPTDRNWNSISANGSYSRFFGAHTIKGGADFRKIALDFRAYGNPAGLFVFDKDTTSSNGAVTNTTDGNAFASFLLGFPSALTASSNQSKISISAPVNIYTYYSGGFVQDDWRVNSKFTLNYGLRVEHETGMAEKNNNFTVGFDPNATNSLSSISIPADAVAQTTARAVKGGLMYAGVNSNPTTQGNPPKLKWSPRVGAVYSINTNTVLRAGYGLFWAPYNYPTPSIAATNYGQVGYSQDTILAQAAPGAVPTTSLTNPFPNGLVQPSGNKLDSLTGAGVNISYVDQNSTAPRVQQYSIDLQRELPGNQAISIQYTGSRGDHLGLGGSNDVGVNINQLDPKYMALGTALNQQLPNPFFGNPLFAGTPLATATVSRAQLLRPYPQFGNVLARHVLEGKSRYNAAVIEWTKRATNGFGGRVSYTYSRLMDNLVGEGNFYSSANNTGGPNPINNYNYIPGSAYYNPDADYAHGVTDTPHRVILAPIYEVPVGRGKKFMSNNGLADLIAGGWTLSAAINLQSGFPLIVAQSDNTGTFSGVQRPNLVSGVSLSTSGSLADRLASADHPTATYLNPAAFSAAAPFTYGNAPRTITDLRTPAQYNVDGAFIKNIRFGNKSAQLKIEMLNLLNRVQLRTLQGRFTYGDSNFGQTGVQAGFMRITQVMLRYSF